MPLTSRRWKARNRMRDEIAHASGPAGTYKHQPRRRVEHAEAEQNSAAEADASRLERSDEPPRPTVMKAGIEDVDGSDDAGAAILRRPGLNGGERGHDEEAARDRQAGEVDGTSERRPRAKHAERPIGRSPSVDRRRCPARSSANTAMRRRRRGTRARFGCLAGSQAASAEPSGDADGEQREASVTTPSLPPMPSLTSVGSSDRMTAPTSQNHDTMSAPCQRRRSLLSSLMSVTSSPADCA